MFCSSNDIFQLLMRGVQIWLVRRVAHHHRHHCLLLPPWQQRDALQDLRHGSRMQSPSARTDGVHLQTGCSTFLLHVQRLALGHELLPSAKASPLSTSRTLRQ
ncbi:hypothetical protein AB1Y20_004811 [Prymnesium parvum]|uniref:Secreted protein n=1 Tax=Prymnesium parvum TaxID=97485 RepID=A0AB34IZU2_PRYPA